MVTQQTFTRAGRKAIKVIIDLSKYIIPSVFFIKMLEHSGWLDKIANIFKPFMAFMGLPGEGALTLLLAQVSTYSAIATIVALEWTAKQITICSTLIVICHAIVLESAIVSKGGGSGLLNAIIRFIAAVAAGLILNVIIPGV